MKSNYRKLGQYIRQVDVRNVEGKKENLLGVSVQKVFIPSIANTVGTDFTKYKVVKKGQFTYIPDTSRRGDKIGIALLEEYEEGLVSNVYTVFEIIDEEQLLPKYLMLWFSRTEFDRYARFKSHGSVREVMDWEEMCNVELPVPDISEQRKIVEAYKIVDERIKLKRRINDNLLFQAKTWFSQFMPYVSGTERLPVGWKSAKVEDFCKDNVANLSKADKFQTILYLDTGSITENYIDSLQEFNPLIDEVPSRAKRKVQQGDIVYSTVRPNLKHYGLLHNPPHNLIVSTGFAVLHNIDISVSNEYLYMCLTNNTVLEVLQSIAENSVSTYPSLNVNDLLDVEIIVPDSCTLSETNKVLHSIFEVIAENNRQIRVLNSSQSVLLPKLFSSR